MSDHDYSQGIMGDGAAILKDGKPMTIEEIVSTLTTAQAEIEALRAANRDLQNWFNDARAEAEKLQARVAELVEYIKEEVADGHTDKDYENILDGKIRIQATLETIGGWLTLDEFNQEANEGWCWIVYKGRVTEAYHDHQGHFRFHRLSQNVYLSECISAVMPWPYPEAPTELENQP